MLKPVIDETAKAVKEEFRQPGQVVVAALDCQREGNKHRPTYVCAESVLN